MFWIIAIIVLLVICWPFILHLLAPVAAFIITIIAAPCIWLLKAFRRPTTQAEEDKLSEDAAKLATILLCLTIMGLVIWWGIRTI